MITIIISQMKCYSRNVFNLKITQNFPYTTKKTIEKQFNFEIIEEKKLHENKSQQKFITKSL